MSKSVEEIEDIPLPSDDDLARMSGFSNATAENPGDYIHFYPGDIVRCVRRIYGINIGDFREVFEHRLGQPCVPQVVGAIEGYLVGQPNRQCAFELVLAAPGTPSVEARRQEVYLRDIREVEDEETLE